MVTNGAAAPRRGGLAEWQLNRVAVYTEANLAGQIRIADLAACTGLSASYFFQAFRRSTGLSPYAYIIRHRVARVQRLLIHTRQPLSHVALECGLADQPHLTRLFRRIVGMSPAAWRRMQQATPLSHG
jgi:AraC-like DNA-binding protein